MSRTKIIPRIFGGIGNQLFCYAAARRLALMNNAELVIDDISGFERDFAYQQRYQLDNFNISCRKATAIERLEPFARYRRYFKRQLNRRLPFGKRRYIVQEGRDFDPRLLHVKPHGAVYLEGYWQSEDYFIDVETVMRSDLQIKPPVDETNVLLAARIRDCPAVAVHVRFFDAPTDTAINNAPDDYYARAIAEMETIEPGAHFFLFSDRPDDARARMRLPDVRVTCVSHNQGDENAYADLWLMSQCKHFIIANSTFSWWGAWLSTYAKKEIIAPEFEMSRGKMAWGFEGLLPKDWIKL